jgi:hypothetical protein
MAVDYATTNIVGRGLGLAFASEADTTYVYYKAIAEKRIAIDAPTGMDSILKDHCTMLMICHLYASADPSAGMRSFSSGDFSGSQDAGSTIYLIEYRQVIEDSQASAETSGDESSVARCDAVMAELQLDNQKVPTYFTEVVD